MIEWLFNTLMAPISWAVESTIVFAVTAPINHIYIALGVATVLLIGLLWSMRPIKAKSHNIEPMLITPYVATGEDEQRAREILIGAQTI